MNTKNKESSREYLIRSSDTNVLLWRQMRSLSAYDRTYTDLCLDDDAMYRVEVESVKRSAKFTFLM